MSSNKDDKLSVFISLILRHKPEAVGISLDESGYANVDELIQGINNSGRYIDREKLKDIVESDKKRRYSFDETMTFIRANQGHSVPVKVPMKRMKPPECLYHGTAKKNIDSIEKSGIKKMNRLNVHLSADIPTAMQVGKRHGEPVILQIDTEKMHKDGYEFYLSENNVWQVDFVPSEYIKLASRR